MKDIIDIIKGSTNVLTLKKVDDESIKTAEKKLGLTFSKEYKKYTGQFGAISMNGSDYTGVVEPAHLNVVSITESGRSITPDVPQDWYVVMDPNIDGIIVWQDKDGAIYQTAPNIKARKIAGSLAEYMMSQS